MLREVEPAPPAPATARPLLRAGQLVAQIDGLLGRQLDAILHHPRFQLLEASWRGLRQLVDAMPRGGRRCRVALLNASWQEVSRDLERSLEFDLSALHGHLYSNEFDMPGGEPFGVVICNYRISHRSAADLRTLKKMGAVAEAAFCVLLFPASPELFGMDELSDLHPSVRPQSLFLAEEYLSWRSLRDMPASRFLCFLLPRMLLRKPWGEDGLRRGRFPYRERCARHDDHLWGHPGFALAAILLREFDEVGWFAHVRGAPRDTLAGGIVTDLLPVRRVDLCDDQVAVMPALEIVVSDSMESDLTDCGFVVLSHCWQTSCAAFLTLPSLYRLQLGEGDEAVENERIGSQVQNILCASRFAHYIKVMMRDKVGSYLTPEVCEHDLHDWLQGYCAAGENLDWKTRARYPLRSASVKVRENPMSPGHMLCRIALSPHYQFDGLVGEINLTTQIAGGSTRA